MKLVPYKQILKFSKEKIQDTLAPIRAKQAHKRAELEISKLEENIANQEMKIQEICTEQPLDFTKLMDAQDKLALEERRKKQLEKIINELFVKEEV